MLNGISLFSGIRGIDEALLPWVKTAAYCEIDPYSQVHILDALRGGTATGIGIMGDIHLVDVGDLLEVFSGRIDLIHAGFPCQDLSVAGRIRNIVMPIFHCTFKVEGTVTYEVEANDQFHAQRIANSIKLRHRGSYHPQMTMGEELSDAINPYFPGIPEFKWLKADIVGEWDPEIEEIK